jgi:hypothetical protein
VDGPDVPGLAGTLEMSRICRSTVRCSVSIAWDSSSRSAILRYVSVAPPSVLPRQFMSAATQAWMPAVLSLFGTLIVVVFTAWLNTRAETRGEIGALRSELHGEIAALRSELHGEIAALRSEVQGQIAGMHGEISALRAEMRQGFAELRLEFHTQISDLSHRVERLEDRPGIVQRP